MNDQSLNQNKSRIKRLPMLAWIFCGALVAAGIGALIMFAGHNSGKEADPNAAVEIQTAYGTVLFPEAYIEHLRHEQITEGPVTAEVFSMVWDGGEQELFRLAFGDEEDKTPVGYLHTENSSVAVSLLVSECDLEIFPNDETRQRYQQMKAGVDTVLDSITADERFSEHRISEKEKQETELTYWMVSLPDGMVCEEHLDGGSYQAVFYGTLGNEQWKLYTVRLEDSLEAASIGSYLVDGKEKQIYIETEDPSQFDTLPEEEKYLAYVYMDTVNDVITAIVDSENYVDAVSPEA